jgi:hypothetical protein
MKSYKRTFLTNKGADSYIRWDISNYKGGDRFHSKPSVDVQLKIADCQRSIYLEFGMGFSQEKKQIEKLRKFKDLINEFCDLAEKAYEENERNHKEYKPPKKGK